MSKDEIIINLQKEIAKLKDVNEDLEYKLEDAQDTIQQLMSQKNYYEMKQVKYDDTIDLKEKVIADQRQYIEGKIETDKQDLAQLKEDITNLMAADKDYAKAAKSAFNLRKQYELKIKDYQIRRLLAYIICNVYEDKTKELHDYILQNVPSKYGCEQLKRKDVLHRLQGDYELRKIVLPKFGKFCDKCQKNEGKAAYCFDKACILCKLGDCLILKSERNGIVHRDDDIRKSMEIRKMGDLIARINYIPNVHDDLMNDT